jgi:UDP-glucuronate decarboxylase
MKKRILVTGAAGFLGSHLVKSLLDDGHSVLGMDNLSTGSMKNLEQFSGNEDFGFANHDVTVPYHFIVDEIYNLACPASPPAYQADRYKTLMTSVKGVENALKCARSVGMCKVFHTSTSEVYGDPLVHPQVESYWGNVNTVGPRSCYDEGKRVAETMLTDFSKQYGVPVKIVRIFNTYGPNMDPQDGRVVSNFIMQALRHEPFTIYGTGRQTRSFCYVSDMIAGFRKLMDETSDFFIEPINIGNPNEFTLMELADMVAEKVGIKPVFMFKSLPGDDPKQRRPDISKAQRVLNWEPKVMLDEGLDKTIEYFKTK